MTRYLITNRGGSPMISAKCVRPQRNLRPCWRPSRTGVCVFRSQSYGRKREATRGCHEEGRERKLQAPEKPQDGRHLTGAFCSFELSDSLELGILDFETF